MQNQTIFELYTDDNKSKSSSNPLAFLNLQKVYGKLYTKETSIAAATEFLSKIPKRKKISNEQFNLCETEISLNEIIKSINSETNNNSASNDDSLTGGFCKHFSNEQALGPF